jgi:SAM-dependent methyltransferase
VLLAFAQPDCLQDFLAREGAGRCFRADYARGPFGVEFLTDLRRAGVADATVDWILCSHVLEHIAELHPCLTEMARMLRPGGAAWIQVPVEPGLVTSRRISIDTHRCHAHAWQFGVDVAELLRRPEWVVEEVAWDDLLDAAGARRHGIAPDERFWRLTRI